jgi:hypothetical protein
VPAVENKVQANLDFQVRLVTIHVAGEEYKAAAAQAGNQAQQLEIMAGTAQDKWAREILTVTLTTGIIQTVDGAKVV